MSHFVLVHGSCHGEWCCYKLVTLLKSEGHTVSTMDLAASGISLNLLEDVKTVSDYMEPLMVFMSGLSPDEKVVLVGHSMGRVAVSVAMEKYPSRINVAVFVSAFMRGPDLSFWQIQSESANPDRQILQILNLGMDLTLVKMLRQKHTDICKQTLRVHGACHGAWCWYKLATLLKSEGHTVSAVDLAASGVNPKQLEELKTVSDYMEPLMVFMSSLPPDEKVVLVGHSMGGIAVSVAMEKYPARIKVAVFVTAFMPGPDLTFRKIRNECKPGSADPANIEFVSQTGQIILRLLFCTVLSICTESCINSLHLRIKLFGQC